MLTKPPKKKERKKERKNLGKAMNQIFRSHIDGNM
jgi:hypothetical protein